MKDGRQYRCYPDPQALDILPRWIGHQRFIYNAKVREDRYFRAFQRRFVALAGVPSPVDQKYSQFVGEETVWLREVPSQILRNGAVRFAQAYSRFFQRLARRPTIHSQYRRQSVWVTRELFTLEQCAPGEWLVRLATKRKTFGTVRVRAHRPFPALPNAITIGVEAGRWYVSFAIEDERPEPSRDEIQYRGNVRKDFAHKTSRALVDDPSTRVIAYEDLKIKAMTAHPKAKQDAHGHWLQNGAAAKAGLNRTILGSAWGKVYEFTRYKALRAAKLVVKVPAPGSSQECSRCRYTHPDNRPSQAVFVCQRCGHAENADENASQVIQRRGVETVLSGRWRETPPKKTMRLKSKTVGQERSEPSHADSICLNDSTPAEIHIRHGRDYPPFAHGSLKPETPATARSA